MKTNNRRFEASAMIDYLEVLACSQRFQTTFEYPSSKLEELLEDEISEFIEEQIEDEERYKKVSDINVDRLEYTIEVSANVEYLTEESKSDYYEKIFEFPYTITDQEVDDVIEDMLLDTFYDDVDESTTEGVIVSNFTYKELPALSPMKVMELENEKKLFED